MEKTERTEKTEKTEKMVAVVCLDEMDLQIGSFGIDDWDRHNTVPFGIDYTCDLALFRIDNKDCLSFHHTFNNTSFHLPNNIICFGKGKDSCSNKSTISLE